MQNEKKLKILLVDDDRFLLDMYSLKFRKSDIEVEACSSSINALEKIQQNDYDIILLDIVMPGMDGIELLKKIRDGNYASKSKIIMLTNQADDYDKAQTIGVDGYIIKATTIPSEVVEQVLNIYNKKQS